MITIRLPSGEIATVNDGVWTVPENAEFTRVLNLPEMQPPRDGTYAPTEDTRMAEYVLSIWGGTWVSTDEYSEPGLIY